MTARPAMASPGKFAVFVLPIWLIVSCLLVLSLWRNYTDSKKPWLSQACSVSESAVISCKTSPPSFRANISVSNNYTSILNVLGNGTTNKVAKIETKTRSCAWSKEASADDVAAFPKNAVATCYVNPSYSTDVTLFADIASVPSAQRTRHLVIAIVVTFLTAAISIHLTIYSARVYLCGPAVGGGNHTDPNNEQFGVTLRRRFSGTQAIHGPKRLTSEEAICAVAGMPIVDASPDKENVCVICLDDLASAAMVAGDQDVDRAVALPCHHAFHALCIKNWLCTGSAACPCCNLDMRPVVRPGRRVGESEGDALSTTITDSEGNTETANSYTDDGSSTAGLRDEFVVIPLELAATDPGTRAEASYMPQGPPVAAGGYGPECEFN
jgi:RING-H2 zinc finger domain